ncbi:succinate dehydrogenase hydrophobic membrane anchor subunit [Streptomyces lydicamycinicus]|jgi:succinate dehydrogenase / fumarate reductase membrane anchor subunit|uniref:Putative succinate dehydrogenase membrane anchor subunit n=1 Tax=Streptomyces lydicamycinicus TaxID=1546107 RepID=A0A0P4QZI3_9ACTN|nr:succinate dehydrogenase hydrophobic membrane anchor subunit [Streptomyces lydicamycinicus]USA01628.1 succinate dehydrogenase hydrophobic membrane anchor subunit [Streptomyces lydicamycinicus]GAO05956.1 putative succinate dehydrogenase membrane anchor subunit [Streptomyces lydicamycinicus]
MSETTSAETTAAGGTEGVSLYDVDHPAPVIEPPRKRTKKTGRASRGNFEMQAWLFMRLSGIVLVVLVLGHLLIQLVLDGGVSKIGFAFVAGRWASPFWQVWDLLMLWLAMLHGANGLRTVINDYAQRDNTRFWLKMLLYTATVFTVLLGTLVIFTFDPNIS